MMQDLVSEWRSGTFRLPGVAHDEQAPPLSDHDFSHIQGADAVRAGVRNIKLEAFDVCGA